MNCGDCKSRNVILDDTLGEYYCSNCGLIIEDKVADFSDLSFTFTGDEKSGSHSPTSFLEAGKALGTPLGEIKRALRNLKGKYLAGPSDNLERSFNEALPSLQIAWNSLMLPHDLKVSSALLYRKCIRKRLTAGRKIEGMVLAVVQVACTSEGVQKDTSKVTEVLGVSVDMIEAYSKIINDEVGSAAKLYVNDYVRKGIEAMGLPDAILEEAIELGNKVTLGRLEIGKHPAVVAGAVIYKMCLESGYDISQTKVAKNMNVSERSVRRMSKELDAII